MFYKGLQLRHVQRIKVTSSSAERVHTANQVTPAQRVEIPAAHQMTTSQWIQRLFLQQKSTAQFVQITGFENNNFKK